jgi:signal peptidase II
MDRARIVAVTTKHEGWLRITHMRLPLFASIATATVIADQASKILVRAQLSESEVWPGNFDLIRFQRVENSGAAFGILQDTGPLLIAGSLIGIAAVLLLLRTVTAKNQLYSSALALILGGAIGNLIDRLLHGTVTDFIDPTHYPAFNIADSAIVVGVFSLVLLSFYLENKQHSPPRGEAKN